MLKSVIGFVTAVVFLSVAFLQKDSTISHFAAYAAIAMVATLYLMSIKMEWMVKVIGSGLMLGMIFKWRSIGPVYSLVFLAAVACIALLWIFFLKTWKEKLKNVDDHRQRVDDDIHVLKDKYDARDESLSHLERQVTGLLNLFEVARDFNECLSYGELMAILDKKVRSEIPYKFLSLAVLDSKNLDSGEIVKVFSSGEASGSDEGVRAASEFDQLCFNQVRGQKKAVQISAAFAKTLEGFDQVPFESPLWIFAIYSKEKMIAILTVQGASDDDFPKYELLVSQLALQVKKIELYETVKELSIVDGLTKVFVRRHFLERFEEELKRSIKRRNSLSVLLLDIDHFKSYNDTFGHLVGDGTLREVAAVIREHVRKVDLVARYGGEEFMIVMPEITKPFNAESAERIRSAIAQRKFRIYDEETKVTVSIGLALFPDDLDDPEVSEFRDSLMLELIQKADKALYRAKEDGRNRVVSYHLIKNRGKS